MASILDEIRAEVETELSQQPQEEKPTSVLEDVKEKVAVEPPIEEPKGDFFESAEKWLEPAPTQKSSGDIFLGLISNKRASELDDEDKGLFNALSDEEQYKVAQTRKDIPLDDAQARRIFEVEKSKMPSLPTSWEDWYNLGGDAFDTTKNVLKIGAKVGLGAAEFGRDIVKATDMTVSDEEASNNLKKAKSSFYSFMAPAFEIPESVAWATAKAKEGGLGWADAAGEKLGLVTPEDRFENWKGRRLVSQAQAEYFREHPTVYARMLDNPLAKDALAYIAKSEMESPEELAKRTNISIEEAKAQQDVMAREQVDNLTSQIESELPEEKARVRIAGEFLLPGELGMGTMGFISGVAKAGTGVARGLKYIGKSADEIAEINKAAQALQKTRFAEMIKKRTERADAVARGAGKVEKAIEGLKPAAEKVNKVLGNITTPVLGGIAGYSVSEESPVTGILSGIVGGVAARGLLKGTKVGLEIPTFVRELAEARKVAPLGKTFETLGKSAEGSALKAKILSRGGKTIDNILSNSVEYARSGIHGTTLALATGALESTDPEEMKQMLADGLAITLGGRALQHIKGKMMGNDPIIAQRERISEDSRIHRRYQEADPETQANLDQISDFDNAIAAKQSKLNESESELANLMATYKGSGSDAKNIKLAQSKVEVAKAELEKVKRANIQTRNEFGREFLRTYANLQDITNGVLKTGQNNVGFNILSTDQIYQRLRNDPANNNVPDSDLIEIASQAGFYSNPAQEGIAFDRKKPSIVLNADSIRERVRIFGETPIQALVHETGHFMDVVPEFQESLSGVRSMLFQNEIRDAAGNIKATTPGIFSKAKLVELFSDGYLRHLDPQGQEAFAKLNKLWDESRGQLDENKVADYMKREVMADLLGEVSSRHLSKDLDSATLAMWDRARIKAKKNLLDRAINRFYGLGGRGDIVTAANTRAEFTPEAMAAARDAMRQIVALNGEISPPVQEPDMPKISKAQMMKNSALLNRFGKDSPLFKTEFKVKVFDKDGNQIGDSVPVTTPNPREGAFQNTDAGMKKLSGYGDIPVEAQGLQVPEGGTLVVSRDLVMQPDGVTPVMYDAKDAKKVAAERRKLITETLDTDDYGTPNRFEPVSEGSETYRGTFTPAQIKAIQDMPESLIPKTLKENMLKMNEAIAKGDGTRFIVDYAAVMNDNGKYQAFSPKMYDLVPIGMHLSKAGNFLVTTISVGRIFDKMRLWNERMPGRLRFWDNNLERTFDDFSKYLNNWQQGKAGETGLDADPQIALQKKNIFNDLLSLYDSATEYSNLDRTKIPRRKGDPRGKDPNRTIMSIRVDHIAELLENANATKLPVNYGFAKINFMPERMEGEVSRQEELDTMKVRLPKYDTEIRNIDDNQKHILVYDENGFPAAFSEVSINKNNNSLNIDWVNTKIKNQGFAQALYREIAKYAQQQNLDTIEGDIVNEKAAKRREELLQTISKTQKELGGGEYATTLISKVPSDIHFMPDRPVEEERIVSATYTDPRTGEVREGVNHKAANPNAPDEQTDRESRYYGFKTDTGRVVDREEAYRIAEASGQLKKATSEEDKFNSDRGVLHSNMVEMEPTISEKPKSSEIIGADTIKPADIETSAKPATDAVIKPYSNALVSSEGLINFLPAYHGTPHEVDKFKLANIGTGEGAQAYGWGLYFAQSRKVAQDYKEKLTDWNSPGTYEWKGMSIRSDDYKNPIRHAISLVYHQGINQAKQIGKTLQKDSEKGEPYTVEQGGLEYSKKFNDALSQIKSKKEIKFEQGNLYKVDLDVKDEDLLDWDKPLSQQSKKVQEALKSVSSDNWLWKESINSVGGERVGGALYQALTATAPDLEFARDGIDPKKKASDAFLAAGIPGIRYLDGMSRGTGEGTYNYVIFDENLIKILDKNDKPVEGDLPKQSQIGGLQFMPARPVGKTQVGYDYSYLDEAMAKGKDGRVLLTRPIRADEALPLLSQRIPITEEVDKDSFDYTRPAEIVFYQHENKPVSFKFDPELIEKPVFKDAAIEHAGKNVQLAMADRQTATGGDMGGIIFPWLKSNANASITGNDGIKYRVVWGNNEWKPVLSMKSKNKQFNAYNLLTYLMGEDAHASNAREVRNISNEIENAQISREQKDLFLILANSGVKKQKRADQTKNIKTATQNIEKSREAIEKTTNKDEIDKLKKQIQIQEKAIKLAESKFNNFLENNEESLLKKIITKYKTSFTRFQNKTGSESSFKKNEKELIDFKKTKAFKDLVKSIKNKQLINLDNTFKGRKSFIEEILGLTIDGFNVNEILDKTMDFKNGRINQIVGSVELSRNPNLMAVYLGNDPKQARNMTAQEAKAAAQLKADPNFVPHEAYSWAMLGPVDGNNFLNSNPKTHLEYFPDFKEAYANAQADASKRKKILEGNETTLMGAMRDNTQMPLAMPAISDKK